jgi:hypothetical protein
MALTNMIIGIGIFIFCLFLITAIPNSLAGYSQQTRDLATIFLLFIGIVSIFIGAIKK